MAQSNIMEISGPTLPEVIAASASLWRGLVEVVDLVRGGEAEAANGYSPEAIDACRGAAEQFGRHGEFGLQEMVTALAPAFVNALAILSDGEPYEKTRTAPLIHGFLMQAVNWRCETPTLDLDLLKGWIDEKRKARGLLASDEREFAGCIRRPPVVFVTMWNHRHGVSVEVCMSAEAAEAERRATAAREWSNEFPKRAAPADPGELADAYFRDMGYDEDFEVVPIRLETMA